MTAATKTLHARRAWRGAAILSEGFRPFFLLAALWALVAIGIWTPWFFGMPAIRSAWPPSAWHAHSLLFGYTWAVVAGFLLTAVPNWTARPPITGWPLLGLVALWIAGRLAALGLGLGFATRLLLDLAFPAVLIAVFVREIAAAGNWRNAKIAGLLVVLAAAQVLFHGEVERFGTAIVSQRLAIAATVMLIVVVAGRIIPAFTTNWLRARAPGRTPTPFARFDSVVVIASAGAFAAWVADPKPSALTTAAAAGLVATGALHVARQLRWAPERTLAEPLVAILHVGYGFVGLGFVLAGIGMGTGGRIAPSAALHAWTAGAIATMTLAVMTRASLGHSGRALTAGPMTIAIYLCVILAAAIRIAAALLPQHTLLAMPLAGLCWIAAFLLFALGYGRLLTQPRAH